MITIQLNKDELNKLEVVSKILGKEKDEIIKKAIISYIDSIFNTINLEIAEENFKKIIQEENKIKT